MSLNHDQQKALKQIQTWWKGNKLNLILQGSGGTGKSHLLNHVVNTLPNCSPILLCPTNEALKQLKDKVNGDWIFKTVHSALGIAPTLHKKEVDFEHVKLPAFWDDINLVIADEVSMLDTWLIDILESTGVKILWCGHKSQLPPIKVNRLINDLCISPIFEKGYDTIELKEPMRNKGELWDFNNLLEENIYTGSKVVPSTFDIKEKDLRTLMHSEQGKEDLLNGNMKVVLWSNDGVDRYNKRIRHILHNGYGVRYKYLPGDLIILTSPLVVIDSMERVNEGILKQYAKEKYENLTYLYSNTKAVVKAAIEVTVHLNKILSVDCYKIWVTTDDGEFYFYEPIHEDDRERLNVYYEHIAWNAGNKQAKQNAYKQKHFIMSCFARIKHYFAATSHRLQGASIDKVIVIQNDINKNMCNVERAKCLYVACSRSVNQLYFYRGF